MPNYRSILGMQVPTDNDAKKECVGQGNRYKGVDVRKDPELKIRAARVGQSISEYLRLDGVKEEVVKEADELIRLGQTLSEEEIKKIKADLEPKPVEVAHGG